MAESLWAWPAARVDPHHLVLVPGFFGFSEFGELSYFAHVEEFLTSRLRERGLAGSVTRVATAPTGSVRERAGRLGESIERMEGSVHLIGHSSGGLDARWLLSPHRAAPEPHLDRVRTVVTVATPHQGTPVADFFRGSVGRRLLQLLALSTIYTLRYGRLPFWFAVRMASIFIRVDDVLRLNRTVLDQLYEQLLQDFSPERRRELQEFFSHVRDDQALVEQLTPLRMQDFNRQVLDRPGVRYGAVLTEAPRPGLRSVWSAGVDPYAQATHVLFAVLHSLSVRWPSSEVVRRPRLPERIRLHRRPPDRRSSDGLVPTESQGWGELIHMATADHLDVIGHFRDSKHEPPHYDWLSSGASFDRSAFEALWSDVFDYVFSGPGGGGGASRTGGPSEPAVRWTEQ